MLTVPLKSVAGGKTLSYLTDDLKAGGAPNMNFEHELITVILNEGYSDFVMDAARAAGAGGGTVLHAKGTGGTRGEKFFSVSLADEKDMIYIIAHKDEKAAIMRSINEQAGPGTKAGAICFSLPISSVAGLRAQRGKLSVPVIQQSAAAHAAALPFSIFNLPSFPRGRSSRCRPRRLGPCSGDRRRS